MQQLVVDYIDRLEWALRTTREAGDRSLYKSYLAEAAVLLARVVSGAEAEAVRALVESHDRLRGNTWPRGEEHGVVEQAWARVRYAARSRAAT